MPVKKREKCLAERIIVRVNRVSGLHPKHLLKEMKGRNILVLK